MVRGHYLPAVTTRSPGLGVVVLAAGMGTRMKSALPKVLHQVGGKPMVAHVVDVAKTLGPDQVTVVIGHGGDLVREALADRGVAFAEQTELLGSGDAVGRCEAALAGCTRVMVLNGDSPLIRAEMLHALDSALGGGVVAFASHPMEDRGGFGRVQRDASGHVAAIVEQSDGGGGVTERNAGQYVFNADWLWRNVRLVPASEKGEYYLTHLAALARIEGTPAATVSVEPEDVLGVDNRRMLAEAERIMRLRTIDRLLDGGVTIIDPATTYIDAMVQIEADVTVAPNCYLHGNTRVETGATVGPGTTLRNAVVRTGAKVAQSVVEDSEIGTGTIVGPFAHVRGRSTVGANCELGNYSEVNRSQLGDGVKMHHFSYVGDAQVGNNSNMAAGIITCNYDGVNKNRTIIGERVFLGSDTMLIAPITIGDGAITGAGSVVNRDLSPGERVAGVPAKPIQSRKSSENSDAH
jgi:bifunctional UDP-N-acetylglucosamine pyrophosphorylase / glucosamine-1-phosphate N-acetyltransferase